MRAVIGGEEWRAGRKWGTASSWDLEKGKSGRGSRESQQPRQEQSSKSNHSKHSEHSWPALYEDGKVQRHTTTPYKREIQRTPSVPF